MACTASDRLDEYARQWRVSVASVTKTETSLIAFGEREGHGVVLKVARREDTEWHAGELLPAFWTPARTAFTAKVATRWAGRCTSSGVDPYLRRIRASHPACPAVAH